MSNYATIFREKAIIKENLESDMMPNNGRGDEHFMKKYTIVITMVILTITLFIAIPKIVIYILCPENNDFEIAVSNAEIYPLTYEDMINIKERGSFDYQELTKEQIDDLTNDYNNYKVIRVTYHIANNSKNITMDGVQIEYVFDDNLNDTTVIYNKNVGGDIVIFMYPKNHVAHNSNWNKLVQLILVKSYNCDSKEILNAFCNSKCKLVYFTGPFSAYDGQQFSGIGKHTKEYKIENIMQ